MGGIGFNPVRIDKGHPTSVIIGSLGELLRIDPEGNQLGGISVPFPSQPTFGTVSSGTWIGTWVDRDLRKACMGATPLEGELFDGKGRDFLRNSQAPASDALPGSYTWSRDIEGEPMGISSNDGKVFFAILNTGIYKIDGEATEMWRAPYPQWPDLQDFSRVDSIAELVHTRDGIVIWSESGGVSLISEDDGTTLMSRTLSFPERVIGVRHDDRAGWMIMMSGRYAGIMSSLDSEPEVVKLPGPVMDSIGTSEGNWIWTGWRHDGRLEDGVIEVRNREDIGISILGSRVLTNSGDWSDHAFTE